MRSIVIVEDDALLRKILTQELSQSYSVYEAPDGEFALQSISFNKPDLILLDLMLPKMDGFAVLEKIRKDPDPQIANIPVLVISNLSSNKDILAAKALTIEDYYIKS